MYSARRGVIGLDGVVYGPRPAIDLASYCVALNDYYACQKLQAQLKAPKRTAKCASKEAKDAAA